jgi:hypothetical protein
MKRAAASQPEQHSPRGAPSTSKLIAHPGGTGLPQ